MKSNIFFKYLKYLSAISTVFLLLSCAHQIYQPYPPMELRQLDQASSTSFFEPEQKQQQEQYQHLAENTFLTTMAQPVSTFAIDVDTASYSNVRRFINNGQLPPADAVRIEELINYFSYDYAEPDADQPFSLSAEVATCPWNDQHDLVQIGLKARSISQTDLPPANLVFLIDVSGSMAARLPLVKAGLKLLIRQMRPEDRIAIVVYAGAAGLVLPPTSGSEQATITAALDNLQAGGSTAGGDGIQLAYATAREHFDSASNNRIILATDGDFNVGPVNQSDLYQLIEQKRQLGIFLTVLGFGQGNLNDTTMELLADKGNGHYAYIDTLQEAKKVLVNEMGGTLFTIAKDVKIQLQFNPARVKSYRLIGYENRLLQREDFADDKKDAGELGAGHTVTALYEIVPAGKHLPKDTLNYVETSIKSAALKRDEWLTLELRYKAPNEEQSQLIRHKLSKPKNLMAHASTDMRFASAVAEFGLLLNNSSFKANASFSSVNNRARMALGDDPHGYRAAFIQLSQAAELLTEKNE